MIYPPINNLLKKTGTRYSLVILTAKRARQLGSDAEGPLASSYDEAILEAIEEIEEGKIKAVPHRDGKGSEDDAVRRKLRAETEQREHHSDDDKFLIVAPEGENN